MPDSIRRALDQAGLSHVKVSQDRDKGVVTLSGTVPTDYDKTQAESIVLRRWHAGCRQRVKN